MVVDNNPDAGAATICKRWRDELPFPISCVHEPRQGIPHARNRALDVAATDADWLAFIDDDEVPSPPWLDRLLEGQRAHGADVVTGPVVSRFVAEPPEWMRRGKFFDLDRHPSGTRLAKAYSNNVMFRADLVREHRLRFDEKLSYGVGEDTHFFRRIALAGHSIVWVDDALVEEWIDPARISERWLIERRYLHGVTNVLIARDLSPGLVTTWRRTAAAARRALVGGAMLAVGRFTPQHVRVNAKRRLAYALGSFEALSSAAGGGTWVRRLARSGRHRLTSDSPGSDGGP